MKGNQDVSAHGGGHGMAAEVSPSLFGNTDVLV